jgi:hypothetical protein
MFVTFLSFDDSLYHGIEVLSTPVEQKEEITIHQQTCTMHQKVIQVPIAIFTILHDSQHRKSEAEPRGSEPDRDDQQ